MSNRQSSWMTSSVPRPTAFNSPTFSRLSDVKGRLSFSAIKTPAFKPKQRSLVDHSRSSSSTVNGYHMSKQNPDVLDRLCSPSPSHRDHLLHKKTLTPATVRVGGGAGGGVLIGTRNGHSPGQSSLVKQMLNDKHRAPASLVHLATRGKSFRGSVNISPVVVKLSGAAPQNLPSSASGSSSLNSSREEIHVIAQENGHEVNPRLSDGEGLPGKKTDPCDKNVVLSALRQRRKRWATSAPDDDHSPPSSSSTFSGAPSAKRTKHSSHDSESQRSPLSFISGDRKRAYTAPSYSMSPDSKKSRFSSSSGERVEPQVLDGSIAGSEFECDRRSEVSEQSEVEQQESGTSSKASSRAPSECIGGADGDDLQQRSLTPPVQFDAAEINRKREESLNSLKAVFSPKGSEKKSSNRRKLPIFCATGTKPHLPTPLSTSHSVTQEDLKKDREAAAAKLREILTAEEKPSLKSDSTSSLPTQATPVSGSAASSKEASTTALSGLRLSSTLSGSLPSLPSASSTTKTSSLADSSGLSLIMPKVPPPPFTTNTSTSAPSNSLATSTTLQTSGLSTVATTSTPQQTLVKSVSFAPLPVPTPAKTTQAGFSFPLATASQTAAATTNQLPSTNTSSSSTLPSISTSLQLPQFAMPLPTTTTTTTTTASSATNSALTIRQTNASPQVSKPSGLALGLMFTQQNSTGFSVPSSNGSQLGLFQSPSLAASAPPPLPTVGSTTVLAQTGGMFAATNSAAPSTTATSSGGFKFALTPTTQQQQSSSLSLQQSTNNPSLSTAGSSITTSSGVFGLNAGLQQTNTGLNLQPSSTNATSGIVFGVKSQPSQQQQQATQLSSLFTGGSKPQNSQSNGGGVGGGGLSFNFSQQTPASGNALSSLGSGGIHFSVPTQQQNPTAAAGLGGLKSSNFSFSLGLGNNAQQKNTSGSTGGLNFPSASQSSGGGGVGLSLFNTAQQQQQQQQQTSQPSSIFTAGSGPTNKTLQGKQPSVAGGGGGLFTNQQQQQQQQSSATGFSGFKLPSNPLPGGNSGGLNFTAGQSGVGGASSGSSFPSFNAAAGGSSGFNFSAGAASSAGGGLFQKARGAPGQMSTNPLSAGTVNQPQSNGISFNFSSGALASQQQPQPQPTQSQGGPFAFGQKPNNTGGLNFTANGGATGMGIGNQAQSGSSGFSFSAGPGLGMNPNASKSGSGVFNQNSSSSVFQTPLQQQQSSNMFQTPNTQKQLSFTATPTNQPSTPSLGGFNFQANTSSFSFSAGTPGSSSTAGRPVARARRRKK